MMTTDGPIRILFYSPDSPRVDLWIDHLRDIGLEFTPVHWRQGLASTGADVAIVRLPPEELFRSEPQLEVLFNMGAGIDAILKINSLPAELQVVRLEDAGMAEKMSEYVVYAVAELSRGMERYRSAQRERVWSPNAYEAVENWPIGIMGVGVIGSKIVNAATSLGYPVNGWTRSPSNIEGVKCFSGADEYIDFLSQSRVLVNVLPLTEDTTNILNQDTFKHLPRGSYVINVGRGEHLDEAALLEYIESGHLAGAVLDVFRTEPLPPSHRFWDYPSIRITPHIAGTTDIKRAMKQIAQNIKVFTIGGELSGVVDRRRGY